VFVTGAGTGLGRACALGLAENGAKVTLVGRRKLGWKKLRTPLEARVVVTRTLHGREDIDRVMRPHFQVRRAECAGE